MTAKRLVPFAAFAVALALAVPLASLLRDPVLLPLPPAGEVTAEWLPDGTPVFVVHEPAGQVHVLGATDAYMPYARGAVAWCPSPRRFYSTMTGATFRSDGSRLRGRPPKGLPRYDAERRRRGVVVGMRRPGLPSGYLPGVVHGPWDAGQRENDCWDLTDFNDALVLQHTRWDRARSVAVARRPEQGARIVVRGYLVEQVGEPVALCERVEWDGSQHCAGERLPLGSRDVAGSHDFVIEAVLRGHLYDGRLLDPVLVTVLGWEFPPSA